MANDWFKIAEFPKEKDLSHLEAYLAYQKVEYKIDTQAGLNVLLYRKASDINSFKAFLHAVNQGVIDIHSPASKVQGALKNAESHSSKKPVGTSRSTSPADIEQAARKETAASDGEQGKSAASKSEPMTDTHFAGLDDQQRMAAFSAVNTLLVKAPARVWLSLLFVALGVFGFYIQDLFLNTSLFHSITFSPLEKAIASGQPWRILTPAFIHFDYLHIIFNALWIWVLGARIELFLGRWRYLALFVFTALVSNYTQFFMESRGIFGGLSGVVYGYLGCLMVLNRAYSNPLIYIMPSLAGMMLVFLGLGMFGVIDMFMDGAVANGAHVGGLVAGVIFGFVLVQIQKVNASQPSS